MIKSKMILNSYGIEDAKNILLHTDPKINIIGADRVFYPYVWIQYSLFVGKGRLSKLNKTYDCIIDGVSGSTYEGKGTPTMAAIEIEEKDALESQITMEKCREIGHDFVMKQFLGKAKLLMAPAIEVVKEVFFHKKFYIVHCLDDQERDYFIMVDAIDGGLSVLDCKK
ncbi:hypothetical protein [Sinanaerobacter chloroacetimidivorans]|jgi:hypothetical protein|uniref:Uncharacterized protein n=1 Tax=Sinanaerobacter chloroacetimidivorans TaxID=2818044 RepID=A0A8J7W538_9FIRM|nr:hypothetical protein [Sinanaerobacter chloroacetimidivorans]MBR0599355.1 hypothetical protein [Sinanaerobacter chloroacetimidivorans]